MSSSSREEAREEIVSDIPQGYNPIVHAAAPTTIGLIVLALTVHLIGSFALNECFVAFVTLMFSFGFEWLVHRYILHRPFWFLRFIYRRHIDHHIIYTDQDMMMRSKRELYLILMPMYAILAVLLSIAPIVLLVGWIVNINSALVVMATMTIFFMTYEWLHCLYHLPPDSWLGTTSIVQLLREHHRRHHNPQLSGSFNFNVTFPLFDWILDTKI